MAECDRCGDDVARLFTHRARTETMTHRRTRRVCQTCHPSLPTASETTQSSERVVADGGTRGAHCPVCSGFTVVDTGSYTCVDCGWTDMR